MITVVVADDERLMRSGLVLMLAAEDDLEVVGEAEDGDQAVALVREHAPDVVLMDLRMPGTDGVEATARLVGEGSSTRVLALTTFAGDDVVPDVVRAGAAGVVLKHAAPSELALAIRKVAEGQGWLDPALVPRLVAEATAAPKPVDRVSGAGLTEREREVLRRIALGQSNADIAAHMYLSVGTVKIHVSRILGKLGVRDRTQAAALALGASPVE